MPGRKEKEEAGLRQRRGERERETDRHTETHTQEEEEEEEEKEGGKDRDTHTSAHTQRQTEKEEEEEGEEEGDKALRLIKLMVSVCVSVCVCLQHLSLPPPSPPKNCQPHSPTYLPTRTHPHTQIKHGEKGGWLCALFGVVWICLFPLVTLSTGRGVCVYVCEYVCICWG